MKKILIISFSNLKIDPRVRRQIFALKNRYDITAMGYENCEIKGVTFYKVCKPMWDWKKRFLQRALFLCKAFEIAYRKLPQVIQAKEILYNKKFDIIIANDIESLPLVCQLFYKSKIYFDAHEYAPREFENNFWWKFYFAPFKFYLCKKYIFQCDVMSTVCDGLSIEYKKEFGKASEIIMSTSDYIEIHPSAIQGKIRLIHHGIVSIDRSLHLMIEMMDYVDERFELDLMLIPSQRDYYEKLKEMAQKRNNVKIIEPVSFEQIVPFINQYDVGLYILPPTGFNTKHMLPNKFFEYIQARLAIAIGPSIEMAKLTKKYDLGVIAKDFTPQSMAKELNKLSVKEIAKYKERSNQTAKFLNADMMFAQINRLIEQLS